MAWLTFLNTENFCIDCTKIKKVELHNDPESIEQPILNVWFTEKDECDFFMRAYNWEQGEKFKNDIEKAIKLNTIKLVKG